MLGRLPDIVAVLVVAILAPKLKDLQTVTTEEASAAATTAVGAILAPMLAAIL